MIDKNTIILAYYLFESRKNDKKINYLLNYLSLIHKIELTLLQFRFILSEYSLFDPKNNSNYESESDTFLTWNEYIGESKREKLREIYNNIDNELSLFYNNIESQNDINLDEINENLSFDNKLDLTIEDKPVNKVDKNLYIEEKNNRNKNLLIKVFHNANYMCEFNGAHVTFRRHNSIFNFTEGHHLIPLANQNNFSYSLDVEANIISLCPNCHRNIHLGNDRKDIVKKLYENRVERLRKCGIEISLEKLLSYYNLWPQNIIIFYINL